MCGLCSAAYFLDRPASGMTAHTPNARPNGITGGSAALGGGTCSLAKPTLFYAEAHHDGNDEWEGTHTEDPHAGGCHSGRSGEA